jgi:hypothetical protein
MPPLISIVIVTYNSSDVIGACLDSLSRSSMRDRTEVIVVDNGSTDSTPSLVAGEHPDVRIAAAPENLGYAGGNNLGVSMSSGRHILLLNPDTVVAPEAVQVLSEALTSDPSLWVVGPCIIDSQGDIAHASGDFPTLGWAITEIAEGKRWGMKSAVNVSRIEPCSADRDVDFITGASMMTTRQAWDTLGGLDEDYFLYFEDTDYCARVRRAGGRVRLIAQTSVVHLEGTSFADAGTLRFRRFLQGLVLYLAKNSSRFSAWAFKAVMVARYRLFIMVSGMPGDHFAGVRQHCEDYRAALRVLTTSGISRRVPRDIS